MEWNELDLEAAEPDQDETAAEGSEMEEPDQTPADPLEGAAEEPDQTPADASEDAAEESGEETADSNSEESSKEDTGSSEEDEAGTADDISEGVQQPADEAEQSVDVVTISGNAIIFPEEYGLMSLTSGTEDESMVVQAIEEQTLYLRLGLVVILFFLGVIAGLLFAQCFRLRRV